MLELVYFYRYKNGKLAQHRIEMSNPEGLHVGACRQRIKSACQKGDLFNPRQVGLKSEFEVCATDGPWHEFLDIACVACATAKAGSPTLKEVVEAFEDASRQGWEQPLTLADFSTSTNELLAGNK